MLVAISQTRQESKGLGSKTVADRGRLSTGVVDPKVNSSVTTAEMTPDRRSRLRTGALRGMDSAATLALLRASSVV